MLGKNMKLRNVTYNFVYDEACFSGFHTHKSARKLSLELLRYCSSKIAISRVKTVSRYKDGAIYEPVCLVFINHPCPKMGAAASGSHEVVA